MAKCILIIHFSCKLESCELVPVFCSVLFWCHTWWAVDKSLPLAVRPAGDAGDLPLVLVLPDAPSSTHSCPGSEWKPSLEISCRTQARFWHPCWSSVGLWAVQGAQCCCVFFWVACSAAELDCLKNTGVVQGVMGCVHIPPNDTGATSLWGLPAQRRWQQMKHWCQLASFQCLCPSCSCPLVSCTREQNIWSTPAPVPSCIWQDWWRLGWASPEGSGEAAGAGCCGWAVPGGEKEGWVWGEAPVPLTDRHGWCKGNSTPFCFPSNSRKPRERTWGSGKIP